MSSDIEAQAWRDALRLLAGRDYTRAAMLRKLRSRGFDAGAASAAVARCEHLGYIDDRALGKQRANVMLQTRPAGMRAVVGDLQRRGLARTMSEEIARDAYAAAGGEMNVLADALQRWIARHGEPGDWRAAKRCADHLGRRGFSSAAVRAALQPWVDRLSS